MKMYNLNTLLDFGRHEGLTVGQVLKKDYTYLSWAVKDVKWFVLSEDIIPLCKNKIRENILNELDRQMDDAVTIILKIRSLNSFKNSPREASKEFLKEFESERLNEFNLNCQEKLSLYIANNKVLYNKTERWNDYEEPKEINKRHSYDFIQDVLGGPTSNL